MPAASAQGPKQLQSGVEGSKLGAAGRLRRYRSIVPGARRRGRLIAGLVAVGASSEPPLVHNVPTSPQCCGWAGG